jgi:hypothetical protein
MIHTAPDCGRQLDCQLHCDPLPADQPCAFLEARFVYESMNVRLHLMARLLFSVIRSLQLIAAIFGPSKMPVAKRDSIVEFRFER